MTIGIKGTSIFITGGTGTLGKAFLRHADALGWDCTITVYSRDPMRQKALPEYKSIKVVTVMGDILDYEGLTRAMAGHTAVIHMAAMKHIPQGESESIYTYQVNVTGSYNVAMAAMENKIDVCIGISTDKAANPSNTYGATKLLMEKTFVEFSKYDSGTKFVLCRYGNVIGSTGSVLEIWKEQRANGRKITVTNPSMTRFWITETQAVKLILHAQFAFNGAIVIPNALGIDIHRLAELATGTDLHEDDLEIVGLRPGEKMHECLLTAEEAPRATAVNDYVYLAPSGQLSENPIRKPMYSNDTDKSLHLESAIAEWGATDG